MTQACTPLWDAIKAYINRNIVPFHVPGHKQGRGLEEWRQYLGATTLAMDLTCLPDLDNICNPIGAIQEAQWLAAEAFGADHAHFLVNGTTGGIQAMIMAVCRPGEKLLIPRNVHKSVLGGLILSGVEPVYVEPEINYDFGISMGITPEAVQRALDNNSDIRAVMVIHPNYYGTAADLPEIVAIAHDYGVPVIVDEAHGAHLHFHPQLPVDAVAAGADLVACSAHKMMGSMTQSSLLLVNEGLLTTERVKSVLNLTQTTSPSYLLLCSLDVARSQMGTRGQELLSHTLELTAWVRQRLRSVAGLVLLERPDRPQPGFVDLDPTKLTINVQQLGLSGYEAESLLRERYHVQVELADMYNILCLLTIGDSWETVITLVAALEDLASGFTAHNLYRYYPPLPPRPQVRVLPREAFYSKTKMVELQAADGEISAEAITAYPPGIPLVCPGEVITSELIAYVQALKQEGAELQGTEDPEVGYIKVLDGVINLRAEDIAAQEVG